MLSELIKIRKCNKKKLNQFTSKMIKKILISNKIKL